MINESDDKHISGSDRTIIRELAKQYMEESSYPKMQERKKLWIDTKGLWQTKPTVLVEVDVLT